MKGTCAKILVKAGSGYYERLDTVQESVVG